MKIVLDESVSYGLAEVLRKNGYEVIAIADALTSGNTDEDVYNIVVENKALLITRDYHFTNPLRFPLDRTSGIIFIRHGNLTAEEEIKIVLRFVELQPHEEYSGRLVTLYKDTVKIR